MCTCKSPSQSTMALLLTLGMLLTGCASISSPNSPVISAVPPYDSRIEEVFMYQSRIASTVLDRYAYLEIDGAADLDPTLVAADARMAEVCRYLNEAALDRAEGQVPDWELKLKVFATTGACAQAAQEVESLLRHADNSVATAKL